MESSIFMGDYSTLHSHSISPPPSLILKGRSVITTQVSEIGIIIEKFTIFWGERALYREF